MTDSPLGWSGRIAFNRPRPKPACRLALWFALLLGASQLLPAAPPPATEPAGATEYRIETWGLEEGLPQSSVIALAQTRDGYLWFGTFDGLVRFDGVRFTVFGQSKQPGFPSSAVVKLFADRAGRLWFKTTDDHSISVLDQGVFRSFGSTEGVGEGTGFSLLETKGGELLFARSSRAVRKFDGQRFVDYPALTTQSNGFAQTLDQDLAGTLHGAGNNYLAWFDQTNWVHVAAPNGASPIAVQSMTPARAGGMWMTINGQVARLHKGAWVENLGPIPWLPRIRAFTMLEDSRGALWIGTYGAGLYRRSDGGWTRVSQTEGLPHNIVRALLEDREGSLWVGTDGGGLSRLKPKFFTNYDTRDGLPENVVTAVREVTPGELWIGTHGGGLAVMRSNRISRVEFPTNTNHRWVWALEVDRGGTVWAGTFGPKLFAFPGGKYTEIALPGQAERQSIKAIHADRQGAVWVATHKGVLRYTNGQPREFTTRDGLTDNNVRVIMETPDGTLWFGASQGLSRFAQGRFTRVEDGGQLVNIRALSAVDGAIWVGLSDGLARWRDGKLAVLKKADGLPFENVESVTADGLGNLWLSGGRGVCRAQLADLNDFADGRRRFIDAFLYTKSDGLGSGEATGGHQPVAWQSTDGRLWFCTVGGLSAIDPRKVKPNTVPPPVMIEEVLADAKPLRTALQCGATNAITVAPGVRNVEVHYTGLSLVAPGQVLFKYRLEGLDQDWVLAGTRRTAFFQGLGPGHYRFQVTACNNHGVWNETGASLALIVQPFFWQTAWFQGGTALGIALLLLTIYHRRVSFLKRERQAQRDFSLRLIGSQEQERKRLAGEIHDGLGQNLLIIKNRAEAAMGDKDPQMMAAQLGEITKSALEAIQEVRVIAHNLRPYQLDRLGLTMALQAIAKQFNTPTLNVTSEIDPVTKLLPPENEINFYRIIQESLNNVAKHSGAKNAWLTVRKKPEHVVVEIRDDGRGFDYEGIMRNPASKRGLGLTGLMERARSINGELVINSAPGKGACLTLTVPIGAVG